MSSAQPPPFFPASSTAPSASSGSSESADSSDEKASEGIVLFLSVSVLVGCLCRWLVRRFHRVPLPFTVLMLMVGVLMGVVAIYGGLGDNEFQHAILAFSNLPPHLALYLFLPVLIFDSAFNVHFHLFMHSLWAVLLLAFPGALICLFFTAVLARYVFDYGWSWSEALMLGSVLAATDPVAVVALLRELGSSHELGTLIEGESLLNDGSAFVVYLLTQSILLGGDTSASHLIGQLFQYSLGGPLFGLLFGAATVLVLEWFLFRDAELEITLTIAAVYVAFWVADSPLNVSAVLAIVVMGLVMGKNRYAISPSVQPSLRAVWDVLIFFTNILIFLLSGLIIADKLFGEGQYIRGVDVAWLFLLYVVLHVVRFLSIVLFLPLFRRTNIHLNMREVLMISWSGMRGGVSLILALITYLQPSYDEAFKARLTFLVCGIVLLTLVVNGMTSRYVLQFLKLNRGSEASRLILNSALLHMRQQTSHAMRGMKDDPKFREVRWASIRPFLPQKLIEEVKQETEQTQQQPESDTLKDIEQQTSTEGTAATAAAAAPFGERVERNNRRDSTSRKSADSRRGRLHVSTDDSSDEKAGDGEHERQMQDLIFPPDHPIHRIAAQHSREQQERRAAAPGAEPGDLTLLMMPTLMYEKVMGPLPDDRDDRKSEVEKDKHKEVAAAALAVPSPRQPYSSSVREQRPSPLRRQPTGLHRRNQRQPTASTLMSIFDEPADANDSNDANAPGTSPLASPSRSTLEMAANRPSPIDPPPGPSVPLPPLPPQSMSGGSSSPRTWQPSSPRHLPRPLQPARSRRRTLHHHRQLSSLGDSRLWPAPNGLSGGKLSLLRELSVRFLTAMQADYDRQFGSGLLTRTALRTLTAACEHGIDSGSILSHWTFLRQQLRCPPWLSFLYASPSLLSSSEVAWYVRPVRSLVQHLMYQHLKVSVELTTAFLSANQRLETVLDAFPEVSAIDADAVDVLQQQVGFLQNKALAAWVDVCEGYGEAHSAVVTRHAAIMLLHFQQREIRSLHSTGMLEQREFDLIVALINAKLVRLDQQGLSMHMSTATDLLDSHPLMQAITAEQRRSIRTLMRQKGSRRWHSTHQTVWERGQRCPGLILTVRGTYRVQYDYDDVDEADGDTVEHGGSGGEGHSYHKDGRAGLGPTAAATQSPPSQLQSRQPLPSQSSSLRLLDTKSRLSLIGAYELLTGHSTLGSCRSVTMAESFVLDSECVAVLLDEDDALQMLARSAAEDLVKARWRQWYGGGGAVGGGGSSGLHGGESDLKQYHVAELMKRAHVFRSRPAAGTGAGASGAGAAAASADRATRTDRASKDGQAASSEVELQQHPHQDQQQRDGSVSSSRSRSNKAEHKVDGDAVDEAGIVESDPRTDAATTRPHPELQPAPAPALTPASSRTPSVSTSASTSQQHRISLRYSDVLLIIDGSAVGSGMTRRVRRRRAEVKQQQLQQPASVPVQTSDPLTRPVPSSSPLYLGPCMLRHRSGSLLMSANCLYARWELRDEEIASLHPPPPRADMRQYARELGLQLRLSAAQSGSGQKGVDQSDNLSPLRSPPPFAAAASFHQRGGAASTRNSLLQPTVNHAAAASATVGSGGSAGRGGPVLLPASSTLPLTRLPSSSVTSASSAGASSGFPAAPLMQRPMPLSEMPSPRLAHYLGAADWRTTTEPHSATERQHSQQQQQQQQHTMPHPQRRHSLDLSADLRLRDPHPHQQQRRASTGAGSPGRHQHREQDESGAEGEDEEDMVEVEEVEVVWQPSAAVSTTHAQHGRPVISRQPTRLGGFFAFDVEGNNALTI